MFTTSRRILRILKKNSPPPRVQYSVEEKCWLDNLSRLAPPLPQTHSLITTTTTRQGVVKLCLLVISVKMRKPTPPPGWCLGGEGGIYKIITLIYISSKKRRCNIKLRAYPKHTPMPPPPFPRAGQQGVGTGKGLGRGHTRPARRVTRSGFSVSGIPFRSTKVGPPGVRGGGRVRRGPEAEGRCEGADSPQ